MGVDNEGEASRSIDSGPIQDPRTEISFCLPRASLPSLPLARWRHCSTSRGLPVAINAPRPSLVELNASALFVWMEFEMVKTWTFILHKPQIVI
jgi:hypothetical protein